MRFKGKKYYKYVATQALAYILSGDKLLLNDPRAFNDPYDCSFDSETLEREAESLIVACEVFKKQRGSVLINAIEEPIIDQIKKTGLFESNTQLDVLVKKMTERSNELKEVRKNKSQELIDTLNREITNKTKNVKITCFSKKKDEMLMWAHYANGHKGFCIEFERGFDEDLYVVNYSKKIVNLNFLNILKASLALFILHPNDPTINPIGTKVEEEIIKPFLNKNKKWKYEQELRFVETEGRKLQIIDNKFYIKCPKITCIYVGVNTSKEDIILIQKLIENKNIKLIKMKKNNKNFKIETDLEYKF